MIACFPVSAKSLKRTKRRPRCVLFRPNVSRLDRLEIVGAYDVFMFTRRASMRFVLTDKRYENF